jgi:hypothetical protein
MRFLPFISALLALTQISCTSESEPPAEPRKSLVQRLDENNGYKQDAEGNWTAKSDKRSEFESKGDAPYFQGETEKKTFKTTEYTKKSWWGNKEYKARQYAGNTDGRRFQTTSRLDGKGAPEAGKSAGMDNSYQTGDYATGNAREAGTKGIAKPSDSVTDKRRQVYPAPEIIDWQEQRSLSIGQSKSLLGR